MAGSATATPTRSSASYRRGRSIQVTLAHIVLLIVVAISFYPLIVMALNSFKTDSEVLRNPAGWPEVWTLASYEAIFQYHGGLWRNFMNSVFVATTSTLIAVWFASMAAFAFAKYQFRGRNLIFALLLAMMMVPFEITVPPLYIMFARLGWLNTYQALIVPGLASVSACFSCANTCWAFRAARGGSHRRRQPLAAVLAHYSRRPRRSSGVAILHFMGVWNDYCSRWWSPQNAASSRSGGAAQPARPAHRLFACLGDDHGRQRFGDPADRDGVRRLPGQIHVERCDRRRQRIGPTTPPPVGFPHRR